MPDFSAAIVASPTLTVWTDPATGSGASRLNDFAGKPRRYQRIANPMTMTFAATVGGVFEPVDAALGGRLFIVSWAQWSGLYPPPITQPGGQTSVAHCNITADHLGYFELLFWRPSGGGVLIPFNAEW